MFNFKEGAEGGGFHLEINKDELDEIIANSDDELDQ
jgi:hypothetical protein